MKAEDIRKEAYAVLRAEYPKKMLAREIAEAISNKVNSKVTNKEVHNALRNFARSNKHFAIFPTFFPHRIRYSVYLLDPPFDGSNNNPESIKIIKLTPLKKISFLDKE